MYLSSFSYLENILYVRGHYAILKIYTFWKIINLLLSIQLYCIILKCHEVYISIIGIKHKCINI